MPGWLQGFDGRLPAELVTLADQEDLAERITDFESAIVPGLLQAAGYAHALLGGSATIPAGEVADRMQVRMARQALLDRPAPPLFVVFLHEAVLRVPIGGPTVMADQGRAVRGAGG